MPLPILPPKLGSRLPSLVLRLLQGCTSTRQSQARLCYLWIVWYRFYEACILLEKVNLLLDLNHRSNHAWTYTSLCQISYSRDKLENTGIKGIRTQPTLQDTSASYTVIEDQNKWLSGTNMNCLQNVQAIQFQQSSSSVLQYPWLVLFCLTGKTNQFVKTLTILDAESLMKQMT